MPGIPEYIEQFGGRSFGEIPFSDADNLVISQLAYLDFETVVSPSFDEAPRPFSDVCNDLFAAHGYLHKPIGLVVPNDASVNSMRMAIQKRFSEMKVWAAQSVYERSPALQFAAMTFLLPTGEAVVAFRGTDDTLAGWIEDIDIALCDDIPSHPLAAAYLKDVAAHTEGKLILCGHSKGGHLAIYAAITAEEAIRGRIERVYNNEGPGFRDDGLFDSDAYRSLLSRYRHFVPYASTIGMMLSHDGDYTSVLSTKHLGPFQHDMGSWQIVNGCVISRADVNSLAKITDILFREFPESFSDEHRKVLAETADRLSCTTDEEYLVGIVRHFPRELKKVLRVWYAFSDQFRDEFFAAFHPFPKILSDAVKTVKDQAAEAASKATARVLQKA